MSYLEPFDSVQVEKLLEECKLDEALKILDNLIWKEDLNLKQKGAYLVLKGQILLYQSRIDDAILTGNEILNKSQKSNDILLTFDGMSIIFFGMLMTEKAEEASKLVEKAEILLKNISQISESDLMFRKARINVSKGIINFNRGNIDLAQKYFEEVIDLQKYLGVTLEIVWANTQMARIMFHAKGKFDLAVEYSEKALLLAKRLKFNYFWVALCYIFIGNFYADVGEFNLSLEYSNKSLELFRAIKNKMYIGGLLNNIGATHIQIGNYDLAVEYLEESLAHYEFQSIGVAMSLSNLTEVALEKNDIVLAQKYFNRLESLYNQNKDKEILMIYQIAKALMLKKSSRIRDRAKSEKLLKKTLEIETISFNTRYYAIVHLCDLLLSEFRLNKNFEVFDEINQYISQLQTMAERSNSYLVFCESFILQAKLALIRFDVKAARQFLTQAQNIAESHGIKRLAMKISNEHDQLLSNQKNWDNLKESEAPLDERVELAGLKEQMENLIIKKNVDVPELTDEEPIFIMFISEAGVPIFSYLFSKEWSFQDHLFGGFLTAVNSFSDEMFSKGLDRASFGEYTLFMKAISPYLVCYLFKGQSYSAQHRLVYFLEKLQINKEIWQVFEKYYITNQEIQLVDVPSLKPLITEVFIDREIPLNY
ncbi:MAG: tetratricopeptide repeat protein [Candidatus Heimdallarchaeota archaeon]